MLKEYAPEFRKHAEDFAYFTILQVLMPKGLYSGQNPTKLVNINIPESNSNTSPAAPKMLPLTYRTIIVIAIIKRIMRSVVPIFFFMI